MGGPNSYRAPAPSPHTSSSKEPSPFKVILYHQTHYRDGNFQTILPVITNKTNVTHVILAALHINAPDPLKLTLNDHPPDDPRHTAVWEEAKVLQRSGIKVMLLVGGAAPGTYKELDLCPGSKEKIQEKFREFYDPIRDLIRAKNLDGVDINVEEQMTDPGLRRLITQLRKDFPRPFIITLAPMAPALQGGRDLSLIDYDAFEDTCGGLIDWYNVQFYNGWGNAANIDGYRKIVEQGYSPSKVALGLISNEDNGGGFVTASMAINTITRLRAIYPDFVGVAFWEYFNAGGGDKRPWEWITEIGGATEAGATEDTAKEEEYSVIRSAGETVSEE